MMAVKTAITIRWKQLYFITLIGLFQDILIAPQLIIPSCLLNSLHMDFSSIGSYQCGAEDLKINYASKCWPFIPTPFVISLFSWNIFKMSSQTFQESGKSKFDPVKMCVVKEKRQTVQVYHSCSTCLVCATPEYVSVINSFSGKDTVAITSCQLCIY